MRHGRADHDTLKQLERVVLGARAIPPGRVVRWANAGRRRLRTLHRRSAPPPLQVLEALFAPFDAHVLRALVELGIPDRLVDEMAIADLAGALGCDPIKLERLLRFAAGRGYVSLDPGGRVGPTGITEALRADAPAPWRGWVQFATSPWFDAAWRRLADSLATGADTPFEFAHGTGFFDYTTTVDPGAGETFDRAMAAGATLQAIGLARTLDWRSVATVCDVGGGSGAALDTLQRYRPDVRATLFDLPEVIARCDFADRGDGRQRSVVAGSFFDAVPPGHDRYLLLAVVHDWDDDRAVAVLATVARAMGPDGEAVVVETIASDQPRSDVAADTDLLMFVLATGRERTEHQYRQLFERAHLDVHDARLLPTGATAFTLRNRPRPPTDPAARATTPPSP